MFILSSLCVVKLAPSITNPAFLPIQKCISTKNAPTKSPQVVRTQKKKKKKAGRFSKNLPRIFDVRFTQAAYGLPDFSLLRS